MVWRPDIERITRSEAETIAAVARIIAAERDTASIRSIEGAELVALGPGRYVNRAVGFGAHVEDATIDAVQRFYDLAGLPAAVQLTSLTDENTLARLANRGFRTDWFRWVMVARIAKTHADAAGPARIVEVEESTVPTWIEVLGSGNDAAAEAARAISDEYADAAHRVETSIDFLALVDDVPAACGSIEFADGIAWLGGASTIPAYRNRGLQRQLLGYRIRVARTMGSEIVAATTAPGSVSGRNLSRMGLKLVDVQTVMSRR